MDGFFVAKIKKLSDKRPGLDDEHKDDVIHNETVEADDVDWAAEVQKATKEKHHDCSSCKWHERWKETRG
jgi:hypothetical protein